LHLGQSSVSVCPDPRTNSSPSNMVGATPIRVSNRFGIPSSPVGKILYYQERRFCSGQSLPSFREPQKRHPALSVEADLAWNSPTARCGGWSTKSLDLGFSQKYPGITLYLGLWIL
jgi:hypothetical protein